MQIIKISPQGQITIPKKARGSGEIKQYIFELHGKTIMLQPLYVEKNEDTKYFSRLAEKAFNFWNDDADDVYQKFYTTKKK